MAADYTIEIERGATWNRLFTWYTDENKTTPKDLTGGTAKLQVRERENAEVLLELTELDGIALGGAAGTVDITVSSTRSTAFPNKGKLRYQLLITLAGVVTRLLEGEVHTDEQITK